MNRLSMRTLLNFSPTFALYSTLPSFCAKILAKSGTIRCWKLSAIVSRRTETVVRLFLVADPLLVLPFLQVACHQELCHLFHLLGCLLPMVDSEHLHRLPMVTLPTTEVRHHRHLVTMEDHHRLTINSKLKATRLSCYCSRYLYLYSIFRYLLGTSIYIACSSKGQAVSATRCLIFRLCLLTRTLVGIFFYVIQY
jgi:hypothetical protein